MVEVTSAVVVGATAVVTVDDEVLVTAADVVVAVTASSPPHDAKTRSSAVVNVKRFICSEPVVAGWPVPTIASRPAKTDRQGLDNV
ncbi:MAG: hypothetical protein U9N84_10070, partial [Actinomycetota bacterium]|nr:hypothetical protein [Actinomycetota bacterium]